VRVKLPKETLLQILDREHDTAEVISDEIVDSSRWSNHYELIFKLDDKFYRTSYSVGATESQDEGPWEYEEGEIDCTLVEPREVTVIKYVAVKPEAPIVGGTNA